MGRLKSLLVAGACAAAVAGLCAGPALAGEVTGSGKKEDQNVGKSWCSFSGLNDDPGAPTSGDPDLMPNGPGGTSQSFGQENRLGLADPHEGGPGLFCNPHISPFGPQPNRPPDLGH